MTVEIDEKTCPNCGNPDCWRDEVDVGVGVIYGPYGCPCGWSADSRYDRSKGASAAQRESPSRYVDQWGGSIAVSRIADNAERLGIPRAIVEEAFKVD